MVELEEAVRQMKTNTTPGPDGYLLAFIRTSGGR
jgi:hypothetical protein